MAGSNFHGIYPAVPTAFTSSGELDIAAQREIVDWLVAHGVHGIFGIGSTGEAYALSVEERVALTRAYVGIVNGRAPLIIGTGAVTTRDAVRLSEAAQEAGCDAVSVLTPYFIRLSEDEIRAYYRAVLEAVTIPVFAYTNPGRAGNQVSPALASSLVGEYPHFIGIKDSSGDLSLTLEYKRAHPGFRTFVGRDTLIFAALTSGCDGAVAATASVAPALAVGIYDAVRRGDYEAGRRLQTQLAPIRGAFSLGSFPAAVKEGLEMLGLPAGPCRAPVAPLQPTQRAALRTILARAQVLPKEAIGHGA